MNISEDNVREFVANRLRVAPEQLTANARFGEDLGVGSLESFELVMALEDEYDIKIPDEEAAKLDTFERILSYLRMAALWDKLKV